MESLSKYLYSFLIFTHVDICPVILFILLLTFWLLSKEVALERDRKRESDGKGPRLFSFLEKGERNNPEGLYYQWRVYSALNGDFLNSWFTLPHRQFVNGKWWIPPPCTGIETITTSVCSFSLLFILFVHCC